MSKSHISGSWSRLSANFLWPCHIDFLSGCTGLHCHQQWRSVPLPLHPHQHDLSLWFFATVIFLYIYLIIYFPPPLSFFPASLSHCRSSSQIVLPFSFKVTCIPQPSYFPVLDSCCLSWPLSIFMFYIYIICICNIQVWLILFDSTSPSSFRFPARFHSSSWHGKIPSCLLLVDIQADPIAWQFCLMQQ